MPPWQQDQGYCNHASGLYGGSWTSDNVFCNGGAVSFWQTSLYIALAFWGFFTVLHLFTAFDIQHSHGHALARAMQHLMRQVILFFIACGSFFLMLLAHQLVFLISNALVGGHLPQWRVDALWGAGYGDQVLKDTENSVSINCDWSPTNWGNCLADVGNWLSGGNVPNQNQIYGFTWAAIASGLGAIEDTILQATGSIRFLVMLLLVGSAPLAIIAGGFEHFKRSVFFRWLEMWLELEGLAILSAVAIACFERVVCPAAGQSSASVCSIGIAGGNDSPINGIGKQQYAFLLLGFAGIICGLQVAYVWRFIGQIITIGTGMYQADYNRWVASAKAASNLASFIPVVGGDIKQAADSVMSVIPQANGYQGATMRELPPKKKDDDSSGGGSGNGGSGGNSPPPQIIIQMMTGGGGGGGGGVQQAFINARYANSGLALPPGNIVDSTLAPSSSATAALPPAGVSADAVAPVADVVADAGPLLAAGA